MKNYHNLVSKQRMFFRTGKTKNISYRLDALHRLRSGIKRYEHKILEALKADLNKSEYEAYTCEIGYVLEEIRFVNKHLSSWAKPKKVKTPITHIGAIAAGNCAVIKPSELTPRTSLVLEQLITDIFPEEYIAVVQGGVETSQALLREKYNTIFFTGSVAVGKIVMEAAAKHLTPVTLELSGKSPCIVHKDAHIKYAAKRIAWGKFLNAGQTCVAPDYVYVHHSVKDRFIVEFNRAIKELYGENPLNNPNYTHIANERHFNRLTTFLKDGKVIIGGKNDKDKLVIEPTVLTDITWDDSVMEDEIFGPILPIMDYSNLSDVIKEIRNYTRPLALYMFTESSVVTKKVLKHISFGGGCINDTIYHLASPYLPFGGVGNSGMGAYHGKGSFDTFSHKKSILKQTTCFDIPLRYPDAKNGLKFIKYFMK